MDDAAGQGAAKSRVERRKARTRRKIISVAIDLIRRDGYEATAMEHIAEVADIAKGTLYNYFPAKEAIISAYVQQAFQEQHPNRVQTVQALPDTRARLVWLLGDLMQRVQGQPDIFELYLAYRVRQVVSLRPDMSEGGRSGFGTLAVAIIRLGQQDGELRADLSLSMLVELFEFVFVAVAKPFYLEPETYDVDAAIAQGVSLYMRGAAEQT